MRAQRDTPPASSTRSGTAARQTLAACGQRGAKAHSPGGASKAESGLGRMVGAAPGVAGAFGYDIEVALEDSDGP